MRVLAGVVVLVVFCFVQSVAAMPSRHPVPRPAPEWIISEWINGPAVTLHELRGKVVILEFFQLWCPGCNGFSIPLIKQWQKTFAKEIAAGRLVVISLHTVFEGHDYQNPTKLRAFLKEKKIRHLVGIDRHVPGRHAPRTMRRYGTMGTPEMAFIDQDGVIQFQEFGGFDVEKAENLLRQLLGPAPAVIRSNFTPKAD